MADDEQFSLCWNNFNSNLSAGFHESLCRGDLVDVTLAAEGQFIKAHRLVLSVCSPYFRKMFTQMPTNQHAFVFLKDVSHCALKDLIQFMYCGEVNVKQDALPAFISTAEALQIKGLTDGDPAPAQSPATPSTSAPQTITTIPAQQTMTSPRVKQQRTTSTVRSQQQYKFESADESGDDNKSTQIVIQTSNNSTPVVTTQPQTIQLQVQQPQQQTVQIQPQTQKRGAAKNITTHMPKRTKIIQQQTAATDPLESTEPTITVQTISESKSVATTSEPEFIDLPMDLPTKSEPEYADDTGDVETVEQEQAYVEDDSYGDMKYDDHYFTENDETGTAGGGNTSTNANTATVKLQQSGTFSESYVSDAGDQSATEAQVILKTKQLNKRGGIASRGPGRPKTSTKQVRKSIQEQIQVAMKGSSHPVVYASSIKGAMKLVFEGHHFKYSFKRETNCIWQCCNTDPRQCEAKVVVNKNRAYKLSDVHNHSIRSIDQSATAGALVMSPSENQPTILKMNENRNEEFPMVIVKTSPNGSSTGRKTTHNTDESMSPEDFKEKIKLRLQKALLGKNKASDKK